MLHGVKSGLGWSLLRRFFEVTRTLWLSYPCMNHAPLPPLSPSPVQTALPSAAGDRTLLCTQMLTAWLGGHFHWGEITTEI